MQKSDRQTILAVAQKYEMKHLYLFGSAAHGASSYNDIDLGVIGLAPQDYFKFYGELMTSLNHSVDLVDLTKQNRFNTLVTTDGELLI